MKKIIFTVVTTISFLFFGCASTNTSNKPEDYYSENYRRYRTENRPFQISVKFLKPFTHICYPQKYNLIQIYMIYLLLLKSISEMEYKKRKVCKQNLSFYKRCFNIKTFTWYRKTRKQ